jgi:hypothetical protein
MQTFLNRVNCKYSWFVLALFLLQAASLCAEDNIFATVLTAPPIDAPSPAMVSATLYSIASPIASPSAPSPHRFWDSKNRELFAGVTALSAADFVVTRSNLRDGGRELDPVTRMFGRSTPGLALNFSLETAGIVVASYLLHKTGHHKLERIVSVVNIGSSATAVGYGLAHR